MSFFSLSSFSTSSGRKGLEQRTYQDDERIATLEQQLAEAQLIAEDSDRKYDEVIRTSFILSEWFSFERTRLHEREAEKRTKDRDALLSGHTTTEFF